MSTRETYLSAQDLEAEAIRTARSTYHTSLLYILLGFAISAALAWSGAISAILSRYSPFPHNTPQGQTFYAMTVTLIAVVAYQVVSKVLKQEVPRIPVIGVVA